MNRDNTYQIANGLGFTFSSAGEGNYTSSPEMFISDVAARGESLLRAESRLYSLTRTWVRANAQLLRPDGLSSSSKDLSPIGLRFLLSICLIAQDSDPAPKRWNSLIRSLSESIGRDVIYLYPRNYPQDRTDEFLRGAGIHYRRVAFQDNRKFRDLRWIIERNPWIRNRVLMTVSARADIYTYLSIHSDAKEKDICDELGVGKSSFYSIKKSFDLIRLAHG